MTERHYINKTEAMCTYFLQDQERQFLVKLVGQVSQLDKEEIIEEIVTDDNVQFFRLMISVDIDQHVGEQLLMQIVQLCITIHGLLAAGAFVEQYKQVTNPQKNQQTYTKD